MARMDVVGAGIDYSHDLKRVLHPSFSGAYVHVLKELDELGNGGGQREKEWIDNTKNNLEYTLSFISNLSHKNSFGRTDFLDTLNVMEWCEGVYRDNGQDFEAGLLDEIRLKASESYKKEGVKTLNWRSYRQPQEKMSPHMNGENYEGFVKSHLVDPLLTSEEAFDASHQAQRFVEHNLI